MSLGDLDELVLSCRDEEARGYIAEAVACYRAGAFRACVVSTWIAVVFDLIAKIKELSLSGDAAAKTIIDELANWQPLIEGGDIVAIRKSLDLERTILDIANDRFGFFDGLQVRDLNRLHDDRNRCAHPTFQGNERPYLPSSELARTHLVHAIRHVLSQPPVQGKAATAQILRAVSSDLFPKVVEQAKVQLKSLGLERPKDSLVRAVADHLTLGLFEGGAEIKERQQTAAAIGALHEMYPGESEPRIKRALNSACRRAPDKDVAIVIGFQVFLSQVWDWLDEDNRLRVKEFVRQLSAARAPQILPYALRIGELADVCAERIGTLDAQVLGEVLQKNSHPIAIAKAVDLYCGSRNWSEGNAAYDKAIEPIIDKLDADQVRRILKAPGTGADLHSAHSFVAFARHVYEKEKLPQDEIIRILEEQGLTNVVRRLRPDPADTITF